MNTLVRLAIAIRSKPFISTSLAAIMLAAFWTLAWLIVFFLSLLILREASTNIYGLFIGMWLSTCVEAVIRWFENSRLTIQFSIPNDPNPVGDNLDYTFLKAVFFLTLGFLVTFAIGFAVVSGWIIIPDLVFEGVPKDGSPMQSAKMWIKILSEPITIAVVLACFVLRIFIYKRAHDSKALKRS